MKIIILIIQILSLNATLFASHDEEIKERTFKKNHEGQRIITKFEVKNHQLYVNNKILVHFEIKSFTYIQNEEASEACPLLAKILKINEGTSKYLSKNEHKINAVYEVNITYILDNQEMIEKLTCIPLEGFTDSFKTVRKK